MKLPVFTAFLASLSFFATHIVTLLRILWLPAAVVGAGGIGIGESWALAKGNAWRLLLYWFLISIVMLVIMMFYSIIAMSGFWSIFGEMFATVAADPDAAENVEQQFLELQRSMYDMSSPGFWLYAVGTYLYTIVTIALWSIAMGVAYRFLADEADGE